MHAHMLRGEDTDILFQHEQPVVFTLARAQQQEAAAVRRLRQDDDQLQPHVLVWVLCPPEVPGDVHQVL